MDGDNIGRLIYLGLLLMAVGGYFIFENRNRMGQMAKQAAVWGFIFLGAIAAIGLWEDIRQDVSPRQTAFSGGRVEVPVSQDGHFYLVLELNGTPVRFVVDTGASDMVLTERDARRVGIDTNQLAFFGQAQTANGIVRTAPVRIDSVRLGEIEDRGVRASVNGGNLDTSLLGMSYLSRFAKMEITGTRLTLTR
ncbi:retropepsin-like aspartic protease family protein [Ostreiculturibacter nitratireducens]|uniref:retropepsin-like aspartic protease family protein n=1 Tax=Ostreiculturibacter nitratireducens TaxID=3075226 RepID=UPI0031B5AD90